MSPRKKTGLQHTLGEILREQQSPALEEKSHFTAELLSQVAPILSPDRVPYPERAQYPLGTVTHEGTVPPEDTVPSQGRVSGHLKVPNIVADEIAKSLSPFEWAVYFRLFRLSHGWHRDSCLIGVKTLIESTHISENQIRRTLKSLQQKGLIEVLGVVNSKEAKGTKYRVYTIPSQGTVPQQGTVPTQGTVPQEGPNKDMMIY